MIATIFRQCRRGTFPAILLFAALLLAATSLPGLAGENSRPLKIKLRGALKADAPRTVTVADLDRLPQTEFDTFDPHQDRQVHYRGVLLRELAAAYGRPGAAGMELHAIDEYHVEFSRSEWETTDFLLATRMDGKTMNIRESGPAKVVLEYQAKGDNVPNYAPKWIWLVNRIEFLAEREQ
ncbi:hypothetical protein DESUT3_34480 [Desulfuromonas versatilis]|uniref:Oxidoreductase molybdopterin-binding domain-containing protein n=1 Tax=Desulfuromonas versatilis TaxID=2802975 RepID=A0ABM8HWQ6_9BACT|nr:hypothetical protein [Desulfuromonas versatilis]BCR06379.1 hypothetical protein DESUT3_34480 [Desulfuromonas versatilis]